MDAGLDSALAQMFTPRVASFRLDDEQVVETWVEESERCCSTRSPTPLPRGRFAPGSVWNAISSSGANAWKAEEPEQAQLALEPPRMKV